MVFLIEPDSYRAIQGLLDNPQLLFLFFQSIFGKAYLPAWLIVFFCWIVLSSSGKGFSCDSAVACTELPIASTWTERQDDILGWCSWLQPAAYTTEEHFRNPPLPVSRRCAGVNHPKAGWNRADMAVAVFCLYFRGFFVFLCCCSPVAYLSEHKTTRAQEAKGDKRNLDIDMELVLTH